MKDLGHNNQVLQIYNLIDLLKADMCRVGKGFDYRNLLKNNGQDLLLCNHLN